MTAQIPYLHSAAAAVRNRCWCPLLLLAVTSGCQSTVWDMSAMKPWWSRSDEELTSIDGVKGPIQRLLEGRAQSEEQRRALTPPEGLAAYEEAQELFQAGEYAKAERAFKKVARKYKDSPVEEDALFMVAESQFAQEEFSWAQDSYNDLFQKYPSTRYMDEATGRLFKIGQIWLRFPELVTTDEIQPVNFEKPKDTPLPPDTRESTYDPSLAVPILPNVWDRTRPVFDTEGRALQALKSIWLNDPTGPLADDALMLTASYHLRSGDYAEADRVYEILREQYPKSPHLDNAFVFGSHVKLMSYQGPLYDGGALDEARELKESTLRLYPNLPDRERQLDEIRAIDEQRAAREWEMVRYWQKKGKPLSVAAACREVIRLYPNSSYAQQARQLLTEQEGGEVEEPAGEPLPIAVPPRLLPIFGSGDSGGEAGEQAGRAQL